MVQDKLDSPNILPTAVHIVVCPYMDKYAILSKKKIIFESWRFLASHDNQGNVNENQERRTKNGEEHTNGI